MGREQEPIYDFASLRNFLVHKGYIVESAQGYREIRPEEVTIDTINRGEISFEEDCIYVGSGDYKQQVYLYKRDYRLVEHGKPRFHICS